MPYVIKNRIALESFIRKASTAKISYYNERRKILGALSNLILYEAKSPDDVLIVDNDVYVQLQSYLTSRNNEGNDAAKLAFLKAVQSLAALLEEEIQETEAKEHRSVQSPQR